METLTKKIKERSYTRGDFELSLKLDEAHFYLEAYNQKTMNYYSSSFSNKTIEEATQYLFSNIDDLYEVLTNSLENKSNSKPNGIYVKFNKKEVYFFMKVEFTSPIKKTSSFYLYLKPQGLGASTKKLHSQLEDLNKKVIQLEKFIENNPLPNNFSEKINKLESYLEKITDKSKKNGGFISKSAAQVLPVNNGNIFDIKKFDHPLPPTKVKSILGFDSKINTKYFKFKENDTKISRTKIDKKMHILSWGNIPLNKKSAVPQYFTIRVEKLNPEFEIINACVGVMTHDGYKKLDNLAEHSGEGCYLYGLSSQFFWINNVKTKILHKFGKMNDLIKIDVNFQMKKIKWSVNEVEIGIGELDEHQIQNYEFYPVVTLAFDKEALTINGYMND